MRKRRCSWKKERGRRRLLVEGGYSENSGEINVDEADLEGKGKRRWGGKIKYFLNKSEERIGTSNRRNLY